MKRPGSITVLFLLMLIALIAVGAMAVDFAMVESARTDLRITADLASRAAMVEYVNSGSLSAAREKAKSLATYNKLIAKDLRLDDSDIVAGNSVRQENGEFVFTPNALPHNSFRVNAKLDETSLSGSLPLFFSKVHGRNSIALEQSATATETYLDIVLVLDRSGSMAFDLTGVEWSYPGGGPWEINYFKAPRPNSRWKSLENATSVFLSEMDQKVKKEHVALVTYSSTVTYWSPHFRKYFSSVEVQTDCDFTQNYASIQGAVENLGSGAIIGGTAISSGIDRGRTLLKASPRKLYSEKIIILLTDGQWNEGYDPLIAARAAAGEGVAIYTVSFGAGSSAATMQAIATETGGKSYDAPGDAELEAAFREIARSIGLSFTE